MPAPLITLATTLLVVYVARAPIRAALISVLAVTYLIPATLLPPPVTNGNYSVQRLALVAFVFNLVRVARSGAVPNLIRPVTRLHLMLVAFTIVALACGVMLGDPRVPLSRSVHLWIFVVEQMVFFFAILAAIRAIGDVWWVARTTVVVVVLASGFAVVERMTGQSYARWFFAGLPEGQGGLPNAPLRTRGEQLRVRGAVDFALAYAWVIVMVIPLVAVVAAHARRRAASLALGLVALSIVFTATRSAYVALPAALVLLAVFARFDVRVVRVAAAAMAVGLVFVLATGSLTATFEAPQAAGSTQIREERFPVVLGLAAERPVTGLGYASLGAAGIGVTDSGYLLSYVELGIVGLVGLLLVLTTAIASVLPGLRAPPGRDRLLAAAALTGSLAAVAGGFFYDTFSVPASYRTVWLLAAIGVAVAERTDRYVVAPAISRLWRRAVIPAVGLAAGLLIARLGPEETSVRVRFLTMPVRSEVQDLRAQPFAGRALVRTACLIMEDRESRLPDTDVDCYDLRTGSGVGEARVSFPSGLPPQRRVRAVLAYANANVRAYRVYVRDVERRSVPTWARTGPWWTSGAAAGAAFLSPPLRLRRSRRP